MTDDLLENVKDAVAAKRDELGIPGDNRAFKLPEPPPRIPVTSANLSAVTYDPESLTLTVDFNSGATYVYTGVSPTLFGAMMAAGSPGKFFYHAIRDDYGHSAVSKRK